MLPRGWLGEEMRLTIGCEDNCVLIINNASPCLSAHSHNQSFSVELQRPLDAFHFPPSGV